ncbi:phosphatidylethanolamine/phosphatidyl-N-methylethanolamine N-methyltransferase [Dongia mobilis]|uniref:Phosphatidylethanolamine/phosphatidyl-N-methylethanolamine N-methyltransferase n=1 Tax=Dongia mobilis TaxID=578943 RepID=A0A4R6WRS1_9PROT|nr:phospholipid methyltransferase [Dongia mobilis]TDQ82171.1 phosphatidylethanolamine/phosphatidyl-N-methylethanolamine N-methyltransferase [Dongia mobilis]
MLKDSRLLFKLWLKNPRSIGAVAVSSPELAAAMARQVPRDAAGYVVELGGGTGSVTRALLASGVAPDRLVVVERDPVLHRYLSDRFPGVRVLLGDALHLAALLRRHNLLPVSAIVSSLPLLTFKRSIQLRIGAQAFALLQPGAPFIQFTYGIFSPLPRERLGIEGEVEERVLQNLPPASVWRYTKRARSALPQKPRHFFGLRGRPRLDHAA